MYACHPRPVNGYDRTLAQTFPDAGSVVVHDNLRQRDSISLANDNIIRRVCQP
jgi:hypothetical protein